MIVNKVYCIRGSKDYWERGYVEPSTIYYQEFYRVYYFLKIPIWKKVLFWEQIPSCVIFQNNILGYTDWKSEAPQWMHDEANKNCNKRNGY